MHQRFSRRAILDFTTDLLLLPLLPCVAFWARWREATILREGAPLAADQKVLAWAVGVSVPDRVRVFHADSVPMPLPRWLRHVAELRGWLSTQIAGMTCGYGIVLRSDCCGDRCLLAHELAHVAQYERLGRFSGFMRQYLRECIWSGYPHGSLEIEARRAEAVVVDASTQGRENVIPYAASKMHDPRWRGTSENRQVNQ